MPAPDRAAAAAIMAHARGPRCPKKTNKTALETTLWGARARASPLEAVLGLERQQAEGSVGMEVV